jgi:hypothetical protein
VGDVQGTLIARRVNITDTPVKISDSYLGRCSILIKNLSKNYVYIGGKSNVTTADGYPIGLNENISVGIAERSFQITGFHAVEIWGVCLTGASTQLAVFEETKQVQKLPA